METAAGIFLGLGLAASTGFRVFLPLLMLSLAHHFSLVSLHESWSWVGSHTAIVIFSIATLLETLAYFIPWLDNLLDVVALPMATIAGTFAMASTMIELDPAWRWALALIAGGGTAGFIKGANAQTRLASTVTTGGIGNPVVSILETMFSALLSALSIFIWPLAACAVVILLLVIIFLYRKMKRYRRKGRSENRPGLQK